jgi:hypothetical protein
MKHRASLISCLLVLLVLVGYRSYYSDIGGQRKRLIITQWDAFGYYLYLPGAIIYHDYDKLDWASAIDQKYNVTGGAGMSVVHLENGNNVSKYFCGVALLQAPLFGIGHLVAKATGQPADGFSPPYQYALSFGVILYCFLALLLLRNILLRYFRDGTVAIALLLLCLATNFIQYAAVDNGLSHGWIFPLYVLLLYSTIRWHQKPKAIWAALTGYVIGLATICRPTEAIALFIPLLWNLHSKEASKAKWAAVKEHKSHIVYAVVGGFSGILPQLLYWKVVTGSFVYDVGSKWVFLNPWWRVLVGWEKGWFIYTPVALLFVAGLFCIKPFPFRKAALTFCLLNIWIIISWDEWQYGASYSTRALVQSYSVFALPLAAIIEKILQQNWRPIFWLAGIYLISANLFQTIQYNSGILHYDDMNRKYYGRIYLNPRPAPIDMSLLDTDEWLSNEKHRDVTVRQLITRPVSVHFPAGQTAALGTISLDSLGIQKDTWLRIDAHIIAPGKLWQSWLSATLQSDDSIKRTTVRLFNPIGEKTGQYAFYMHIPQGFEKSQLRIFLSSENDFEGLVNWLRLTSFEQ